MKFTFTWRIAPGSYQITAKQFLSTGAPVPAGLNSLGRWHVPGSDPGWHMVEGDAGALAQHLAEWGHLIELEVSPVIEDADAAASLSNVYGSQGRHHRKLARAFVRRTSLGVPAQ